MKKKYPPYARQLLERLRFNNPPFLVFVMVGCNAWDRAKRMRERAIDDNHALVLPDDDVRLVWPVKGLRVVVEWDDGPSTKVLNSLLGELIASGCSALVSRYVGTIPERGPGLDPETGKWDEGFPHIQIFPVGEVRRERAA